MRLKKIAAYFVAATFLSVPLIASADQISDLLAQLTALQQQIQAAQAGQPVASPQRIASSGFCPNLSRTLQYGMRGDDVADLQRFFIDQGLLDQDSITGFFGVRTERAVQTFQVVNHIVSGGLRDETGFGVVGRRTRAAIQDICSGIIVGVQPTPGPIPIPVQPIPVAPTPPPPPTNPQYPTVVESLLATPKSGTAPLYVSISANMSCDPTRTYTLVYGDGAQLQLTPPGGNCLSPRTQSVVHPYSPAGTYALTLVANGNPVANTNITVTASAPSCWINSSVTLIGGGQQFNLNWQASNASSATLTPLGSVPLSGATTTTALSEGLAVFTLNVTGPGGTATCSTSVTVQSPINTRDAQRMADLQTMANALSTYHTAHNHFPDTNGWINDCSIQGGGWVPGLTGMPRDPVDTCVWPFATTTTESTATYAYWSDDGSKYALAARLENSSNQNNIHNAQSLWFDGSSLENTYFWNKNTYIVMSTGAGTTSTLTIGQRDSQRVTDMLAIKSALAQYYTASGHYPVTGGTWIGDCDASGAGWIPDNQLAVAQRYLWNAPYLATLPRDPIDICLDAFSSTDTSRAATYGYWSDNGTRFALIARLEDTSNPNRLASRAAQLWFDGHTLLGDYGWNPNTYVLLASGPITQSSASNANLAAALTALQSILENIGSLLH